MIHRVQRFIFILSALSLLAACAANEPPAAAPPTPDLHTAVEIAPVETDTPPQEAAPTVDPVSPVWQTTLTAAVNVAPVVAGDLVIVATADGSIHAINAADGASIWRFESEAKIWDASLRVADGYVCAGRQGGEAFCLDAEDGKLLWTAVLGLEMQSRPALVNGRLYAPTTHVGTSLDNNYEGQAKLVALDATSGAILWETVTDNYILRRPTVADNLVIVGGTHLAEGEGGEHPPTLIYAFDTTSGAEQWRYDSEDGLIRWLAADGDVVAFSGGSEIVHALSLASGEHLWDFGPSYWMQFPTAVNNTFFMGTGDERFHALDTATGNLLWETSIDLDSLNQIGRPLLKGDLILFNAVTGDIYALRQEDGTQVLHLDTGISARVGGALYKNLYIMGDPEGQLYAFSLGE